MLEAQSEYVLEAQAYYMLEAQSDHVLEAQASCVRVDVRAHECTSTKNLEM